MDVTRSVDNSDKYALYKKVFYISMLFFFLYTAFNPLANLQSSLHQHDGLGFATLSTSYAGMGFASLFLPSLLLNAIGRKNSLLLSLVGFILFVLANAYSNWWTMISSAIAVGISESIIWCAGPSYIRDLARRYAHLLNMSEEKVFSRAYPMFYGIFKLSQISGNVIASSVLHKSGQNQNNATTNAICGVLFCPSMKLPASHSDVKRSEELTLIGISLACTVLGFVLVVVCIPQEKNSEKTKERAIDMFFSTIREMKDYRMILLAPIITFSGFQASFFVGEFNEAYVTCYLGINVIGWVMISYGMSSFINSMIFGFIGKWIKPVNILIFAMFFQLALSFWLLNWNVLKPYSIALYILYAALYGACDCAWRSQIPVIVGSVFTSQQKEMFSLRELWESVGQTLSFALGYYICIYTKIWVTIGWMFVGIFLCGIVVYRHDKSRVEYEEI